MMWIESKRRPDMTSDRLTDGVHSCVIEQDVDPSLPFDDSGYHTGNSFVRVHIKGEPVDVLVKAIHLLH
jgi:hypothetical protein